ncbi:7alpha-cephem-methoxylase P8 chain related protein [Hirsutella rhossiliensis]|uniref:7alpha-cephem-methoxylase P8 chain related protein n=1 Tax=Hirsutella rhossiliensis TaxID=111463 RepID=A0A9P8N5H0_9HYPO|nr:7alpha-cephem-methoxylase P8 chain related protein [Hirsutella rhossiliensis]KAH0966967.1 7alpha-cephem-methoxylase P8 chain related protein [Hirsutella rhossiliensis]
MAVADSSRVPRGDVTASLNYYNPPADKAAIPFNYVDTPPAGEPTRNFSDATHDTRIHDLRAAPGLGADFSLDRDAFQLLSRVPPSSEPDFVDDDSIRRNYYPEVERLLLDAIPGADRVHIFDHTVRRAGPGAPRAPVTRVHIDQTPPSVAKRVRRYFPDEADDLLRRRYRIVNVWRPLNKDPVESFPLAFASTSTLRDHDVVPIQHRYPDGYLGETAAIRYNPEQKWYYLSGMTGDERLLLECFDSESLKPGSNIGGRVPHSAFVDPRSRPDAVGRESIEVRALVFGP